MTTEQTVSDVPSHQGQLPLSDHQGQSEQSQHESQAIPHGMGQSKSSRRRRRKRKNKVTDGPGSPAEPVAATNGEVAAAPAAASVPGTPYPQQGQGGQPFNGNGQGQGTKRWKKKFRGDRPRSNADNIGNLAAGGSSNGFRNSDSHQPGNSVFGGKRKGKQQRERGPRSFVGPMDHSYRVANGNFADGPPSTIETHYAPRRSSGYQGDTQPIDYSVGRSIPIAEDAPTKIYFFIEDLFITAKIQETARKLGVKVAFIKNDKESIAALTGSSEEERPGLIVLDLNNTNAKPMTLIPKLKTKLKKSTSIVGFLSHLQGDLKAKAIEAGCDVVMPRAAFSQNLPNLLRRYGTDEEEEPNFNQ